MDKELKAKWISALKSGNYKQGTGCLKKTVLGENKYCCLGVLCDLINPEIWKDTEVNDRFSWNNRTDSIEGNVTLPSYIQSDLISLNDAKGSSFEEIADYIDKNL